MSPAGTEDFDTDPVEPDPGIQITTKPIDLNEIERERTRRSIVKIVLIAIALEFPIAVIVAVTTGESWSTVYDTLAYAVVPLVALAGAMGYHYFK